MEKRIPVQMHQGRIWELDFWRGTLVWFMVFDHIIFDLAYVFQVEATFPTFYFEWPLRNFVRMLVVLSFVLICGISCSFSHSNRARGAKLLVVAMVLTLVTWGMDLWQGEESRYIITFGVLHMLALSILLFALLENRKDRRILLWAGMPLTLVGLVFFFWEPVAPQGFSWLSMLLPMQNGIYSADYFSLLPYGGIMLIGAYFGPILYPHKKSRRPLKREPGLLRPILFTGRHALLFYLVHQPVVLGILSLLFFLLRG